VMKDSDGKAEEIVGCLMDISKTKEMEFESVREERNLSALMELHKRHFNKTEEIYNFVLRESLSCTKSKFSFIALISDDSTLINSLFSGEIIKGCHVEKKIENITINETGICKDVVNKRYPIIVNDYNREIHKDEAIHPEGDALIEKIMGIPVFDGTKLVAVAVLANKAENYDDVDLRAIITLLEEMWQMVKNIGSMRRLQESEERFRSFVQVSPSAVFAADIRGNVNYWSKRLSDLTGMSAHDARGMGWKKCLYPDESELLIGEIEDILGKQKDYRSEHRFVTTDNRVLWGLLQISPIRVSGSELSGYVGTFTEITEKKLAEKEMENRLEELERFRKATVQREFRMKELKEENIKLKNKIMEMKSNLSEG